MTRVMVDIETVGTDPGCVVLSIGAVKFDSGGVGEEFYREIDMESAQDAGLRIDANTLKWWLDQDDAVSTVLDGGEPLEQVLIDFDAFLPNDMEVWANSPKFDCSILEAAYDACGLEAPWSYSDLRDVRTLRDLPCSVEVPMSGDEHHALDDARNQARMVSRTLDALES